MDSRVSEVLNNGTAPLADVELLALFHFSMSSRITGLHIFLQILRFCTRIVKKLLVSHKMFLKTFSTILNCSSLVSSVGAGSGTQTLEYKEGIYSGKLDELRSQITVHNCAVFGIRSQK